MTNPAEMFIQGTSNMLTHPEAFVFEHTHFQGWSFKASGDTGYVGNERNDRISSIKVVHGTWRFYEHANYQGQYLEYGPGEYPVLPEGWNDRISSFKVVR